MLLANSCVSGKAATGHVLIVRSRFGCVLVGIALLRSNGRKGRAPSMAGGPCRPRSSSKIITPNREPLVFRNELRKCVRTSHVGGSFFCEEREGDRSIGKANLRKGAALQWLAHLAPVRGASPFNGSGSAAPFYGSGPAARPRSSSKMDSLAWLRCAGAGRAFSRCVWRKNFS